MLGSFSKFELVNGHFFLVLYKELTGILAHITLDLSQIMCARLLWQPWSFASLALLPT